MPSIQKSSRHSKITGEFAENLILYWLSKHGFECARVDHTGIDLIARRPSTDRPMGISVKSRSRNPGTEDSYLSIPNDNFEKLDAACVSFLCEPLFAIVIDEADKISCFILPSPVLKEINPPRKRVSAWKMSAKWQNLYASDDRIIRFSFASTTEQWWPPS